jgi:hypothetical protein
MRIIYLMQPNQARWWIIYCNYTGFLYPHSFSLTLSCSLPFSLSVLGGCQFLTPEAPLIAGKGPCMYNGYIHSKDDFRSPFVKPPWYRYIQIRYEINWGDVVAQWFKSNGRNRTDPSSNPAPPTVSWTGPGNITKTNLTVWGVTSWVKKISSPSQQGIIHMVVTKL